MINEKNAAFRAVAVVLFTYAPIAFSNQAITELREIDGLAVQSEVHTAKETPQRDEWNQPDLRGEFDALIPVHENYPLPEVPSRLHDVATIRDGRFLRPHIPVTRTTNDGRIGIAPDSQSSGLKFFLYTPEKLDAAGVHYTQASDGSADLMSDKVLHVPYQDLLNSDETGLFPSMYAICDTSYAQLDNELYGGQEPTSHRNPYPVADDTEAYELTIWSSDIDKGSDLSTDVITEKKTLMFTFNVRVFIKNPKTPNAELVRVERVGEPTIIEAPSRPLTLFEPTITGDGRLLVTRISGTAGSGGGVDSIEPRPWIDANGVTRYTIHDMVYAYNSPDSGFEPCDPNGWTNLKPLSYAHHDPEVRERYGFAKFPLRDFEGVEVLPGQETGIMYPWVDRLGANIMFTSTRRLKVSDEFTYGTPEDVELLETLNGDDSFDASNRGDALYELGAEAPAPELRPHLMIPAAHQIPLPIEQSNCPDGGLCQESTAREHVSPTRQIGIVGLWTQGKMVQIDGIVNATELGYRVLDEGHKLVRLYHGQGGVVRIGNGRTNTGLPAWADLDTYRPHNDSVMESLENKFFFTDTMKPAAPYDVVWSVSTGRGTSELIFDDYMDNEALILSEMVASISTTFGPITWNRPNTGDREGLPLRVQNSSTRVGNLNAPYGEVFGDTKHGTRIEPVALGGLYGKGLWVNEGVGVRYTFPPIGLPEAQAKTAAYYGLAIDPRIDLAESADHRLITTPTGTVSLRAGDAPSLVFGVPNESVEQTMALPQVKRAQWTHLGIDIDGHELIVYVDGFRYFSQALGGLGAEFLQISVGDVIVGSPSPVIGGLRGWVDEFKVFSRSVLNPEEACNRSMGALVRLPFGSSNQGYPAQSHELIAEALGDPAETRYACERDYDSEGFSFLATVPKETRIGSALRQIKPLKFNAPRPDETDNPFCLVCHTQFDHPSQTMTVDALALRGLPMQFDRRRQPLQPYPAAIGHIPDQWLTKQGLSFPTSGGKFESFGDWLLVDGFLNANKSSPDDPIVVQPPTSGGGSTDRALLLLLGLMAVYRRRASKRSTGC
ncbi:MAG: hypothetical protein ACI91G_000921 [Gammaproteobacteria bacterium]|jgi:hypothetical protein